jgi:hypothetical protein
VREEERSGGGGGGGALQDRAAKCAARGKNWGNYGHDRVKMINALISSEVSESLVKVSSNPLNLAATNKGGGGVTSEVTTTTIDQVMGASGEIELLLLTCQVRSTIRSLLACPALCFFSNSNIQDINRSPRPLIGQPRRDFAALRN